MRRRRWRRIIPPRRTDPRSLYFKIGDVADSSAVKPYVLRYWETEFPMISPRNPVRDNAFIVARTSRRVTMIKTLLYVERYSIEGARKTHPRASQGRRAQELQKRSRPAGPQ